MMDKASDFTIQLLDAMTDILHIEDVDTGSPVYVPGRVVPFTVRRLQEAIRDLYRGTTLKDAIDAMESFGSDSRIQTSGVGYSADFDTFVKLGLLIGERVVLWDAFLPSILGSREDLVDTTELGALACRLLMLKAVVEKNGIVLLPHPRIWSGRYRSYAEALRGHDVSNAAIGMLNARALEDEGFSLHPYIYDDEVSKVLAAHKGFVGDSRYFAPGNLDFQMDLRAMIQDARMAFLRNVNLVDFFEIRNSPEFRKLPVKLRDLFHFPDDLSPVQRRAHVNDRIEELASSFERINRERTSKLLEHVRDGLGATSGVVGAIGATMTFCAGQPELAGLLELLGISGAVIANIVPILGRGHRDNNNPIVHQFFWQLQQEDEEGTVESFRQGVEYLPADVS